MIDTEALMVDVALEKKRIDEANGEKPKPLTSGEQAIINVFANNRLLRDGVYSFPVEEYKKGGE